MEDPTTPTRFLHQCVAPPGVFDEMRAADGTLRPHWRKFVEQVESYGPAEFQRRWEQAQKLLYDHGVTYNVYSEASQRPRPWELDGLPLLISAAEWRKLAGAIAQRARLLNMIAADLYGPQNLVRRGLLPPEFVFDHPGFLRPCHGQRPPDDIWLHLYSGDVVRGPEGEWWSITDRTEAPSGAGYALENRIVTSGMLATVIHDCQVERLASFFMSLRGTLQNIAPRHRDNPRIALLSPGPNSPTYFEDAYLARYLGYTLVEGGDLAVRNDRVQLKTLGGLQPVDVLLHRIDDADCDPLELRSSSILGVPGMLQAVRKGNVTIANTLGCGAVEAPALAAFLPVLCRELLGEDLQLRSAQTWWCGDPASREHVLQNVERLLIRPAFKRGRIEQLLGRSPGQVTPLELADAIRARPANFVAQEPVPRSAAPSWIAGTLRPAHISLRTYAVATDDAYHVMPGGLTRVSFSPFTQDATLASGEGSKDCWVLSEGPVQHVTLLPKAGTPVELRRSGVELPSRVADNLFWLGRQVERAEGASRLLRTVVNRLTSESTSAAIPELPVLIRGLADQGQIEPGFAIEGIRTPLPAIEKVLPVAVFDLNEPRSLRCILSSMHRIASIVRDRLSIDSWRIIHRIDHDFAPPANRTIELGEVLAMLNQVILDLSAFSGLVADSMTRTHGWRFLEIGRRIERAMHTISLVQNTLVEVSKDETAILEAVLEVADSRMTHRSRYLANLQPATVLDLLLTDETNPRALAFQLAALCEHVENLPRDRSQPQRSPAERLALTALHGIRMAEVERLAKANPQGRRPHLERLLIKLSSTLPRLSDAIGHRYLIHAGTPRQLAEIRAEGGNGRPPF